MSASISTVTISRLRWSWATSTTCTSGSLNRASALAHQGESEPHVQCSRSRSSVVGLLGRSDLEGPQQLHLRTATPQPPHPHVRSAVMLDWTRALEPRLGQGPPRTSLHRTTRRSSPSGSPWPMSSSPPAASSGQAWTLHHWNTRPTGTLDPDEDYELAQALRRLRVVSVGAPGRTVRAGRRSNSELIIDPAVGRLQRHRLIPAGDEGTRKGCPRPEERPLPEGTVQIRLEEVVVPVGTAGCEDPSVGEVNLVGAEDVPVVGHLVIRSQARGDVPVHPRRLLRRRSGPAWVAAAQVEHPGERVVGAGTSVAGERFAVLRSGEPVPVDHAAVRSRSEEHTSELQSLTNLVCRLLLEKK